MRHKSCLRRMLPLAVLTAVLISAAPPASAFLFGGEEEIPAVSAFSKNGPEDQVITFSADDFKVEGKEALSSIVVERLPDPAAGVLTLGGLPLAQGDVVAMTAVEGLRFEPASNTELTSAEFVFTPVFQSGTVGEQVEVGLYLLSGANAAPVAQDLELSTYKNVAITERFSATDPEGDLLTFQLVDKPARGAVTMPEDGSNQFVYTPYENKTGKDTFTYVAVDAVGNTSEPATVRVRIEKADTKVTYADLDGHPAQKAAIRLAEEGIFVGACMGNEYLFQPDAPVTRSQFVAMAMEAAGLEALEGVTTTGFADDEAIAAWAKPYASAALKAGLVQGGVTSEGRVVFGAEEAITRAEAAVLLDRALQLSDTASASAYTADPTAPVWAVQSAANLTACGVLDSGALGEGLNRADAAELLCSALEYLDQQDSGGFFHW